VPTVPADLGGKSDAELIDSVRIGEIAAYGTLYERHTTAAQNLARQLARSGAEADDLVSEAFARVLDTLRAGKGPDTAFRAYLLTTLRHTAYDKTRKDKRLDLAEDLTDVGGAVGEALTVQFSDTAVAGLERTMAAEAFAKLPERWQAVLWHTEIEQQSPADVAPLLGLTANGVSALAYRAREGLRQAYLQVHLADAAGRRPSGWAPGPATGCPIGNAPRSKPTSTNASGARRWRLSSPTSMPDCASSSPRWFWAARWQAISRPWVRQRQALPPPEPSSRRPAPRAVLVRARRRVPPRRDRASSPVSRHPGSPSWPLWRSLSLRAAGRSKSRPPCRRLPRHPRCPSQLRLTPYHPGLQHRPPRRLRRHWRPRLPGRFRPDRRRPPPRH
jgi:RNA polymerase sigma factor (sigma-70 family)